MQQSRHDYLMSTEKLDAVAAIVAQQRAFERGAFGLPHGSRLFTVEEGWESAVIMKSEGVARCDTLLMFEAALKNDDTRIIFIPKDARITNANIETICRRNGVVRTIFKEVGKA